MSVSVMASQSSRRWSHELDDLRLRWVLRREKGDKSKKYATVAEFALSVIGLPKDELMSIKTELEEMRNKIKSTRSELERKKKHYGPYYQELGKEVDSVASHIQVIQNELGKLKKEYRDSLSQVFMRVVEEEVGKEAFDALLTKAHSRLDPRVLKYKESYQTRIAAASSEGSVST